MASKDIFGVPNILDQDSAVQSDVSFTLTNDIRSAHVTAAGVVVSMPPNPKVDQQHAVVTGADAAMAVGNGHPLQGGGVIDPHTSTTYTFTQNKEWVPDCCAGGGPTGQRGPTGSQGTSGSTGPTGQGAVPGGTQFAMFYGLTAGTGNAGPTDYAATVAVKTAAGTGRVPFPRNGPFTGGIVRSGTSAFILPSTGTYLVQFKVHTTEPGQLQLELAGADLPETLAANMNPTAGGHPIDGYALITTTLPNSILAVVNPTGNAAALTITPADVSDTHANAQSITIQRLS